MAVDPAKVKKEMILAVVLLVVLCLMIFWNVKRQRKRGAMQRASAPTGAPVSTPSLPTMAQVPSVSLASESLPRKSASDWKRDPFLLGIGKEGIPTLQLSVSGIIYDETRPEATYAIVNGHVYRIGDSLFGIKVIDIQPDFVRLKKFNQDVFLYLHETEE